MQGADGVDGKGDLGGLEGRSKPILWLRQTNAGWRAASAVLGHFFGGGEEFSGRLIIFGSVQDTTLRKILRL